MTVHQQFLIDTFKAGQAAGVVFPDMQACEAAEESGYGGTSLAHSHNNLFGEKWFAKCGFDSANIPTHEVLTQQQIDKWPKEQIITIGSRRPDGKYDVKVMAKWIHFPTVADCLKFRTHTLQMMSSRYLHYAAALAAKDAVTYVTEVSKSWSTDPARASNIIKIYNANKGLFDGT